MENQNKIVLFEGRKIRSVEHNGESYYNLADVIEVLTDSKNPNAYWRKLKQRLLEEGSNEVVTNCHALKFVAKDGKKFTQDAAQRGGSYAGTARENLEKKENLKVVSSENFLHLKTDETPKQLLDKTDE